MTVMAASHQNLLWPCRERDGVLCMGEAGVNRTVKRAPPSVVIDPQARAAVWVGSLADVGHTYRGRVWQLLVRSGDPLSGAGSRAAAAFRACGGPPSVRGAQGLG